MSAIRRESETRVTLVRPAILAAKAPRREVENYHAIEVCDRDIAIVWGDRQCVGAGDSKELTGEVALFTLGALVGYAYAGIDLIDLHEPFAGRRQSGHIAASVTDVEAGLFLT